MKDETYMKLKDLSEKPKTQERKTDILNKEPKKKCKKKSLIDRLNEIGTIKQKEIVEFTRHLSVMLSAGVTIFEAINFLKEQSNNKVFTSKLTRIIDSLNNGQSLSASMKRFPKIFPEIYTNIIQVGENSGTLAETMLDLANHLEENETFKRKVKGALVYPKIILGVMLTFMVALFFWVMPRILTIFESLNADIPASTKVVIGITNLFRNNLFVLIGSVVGIIVFYKIMIKNPVIRYNRDLMYLKIPMIGKIVLNYNTTQLSQHFGTLFQSGLTIVKCLEITGSVLGNRVFRQEINQMVENIKRGASFSQSFSDKSEFPPMFVKLIRVGERTGKLPYVIQYMKDYYKGLVDNDVKNITTIIEPVIMAMLGLMVAGLVITVIGPIYQLISNVGV